MATSLSQRLFNRVHGTSHYVLARDVTGTGKHWHLTGKQAERAWRRLCGKASCDCGASPENGGTFPAQIQRVHGDVFRIVPEYVGD